MTQAPRQVVIATAVWTAHYLLVRHVFRQSPEWSVRAITLIHGVVITILATLDWTYINPWDFQRLGEPNTNFEQAVMSLTLGYFIFDFLWVLRYQTEGVVMYLHHIASIICISYILTSGVSAAESLISLSILEGTNPCLQTRWFLRTHGYQGTIVHTLTEIIFMISFLLLRCVGGSYLTWKVFICERLHPFFKLGTLSLYTVSLIFVYQMLAYVTKKFFVKKEKTN